MCGVNKTILQLAYNINMCHPKLLYSSPHQSVVYSKYFTIVIVVTVSKCGGWENLNILERIFAGHICVYVYGPKK